MKGFIVTYNTNLSNVDVIKLSHKLFGRINAQKNDKRYFYPGYLNNTRYFKFGNGVIFIQEDSFNNLGLRPEFVAENLVVTPAEVTIDETKMITANIHWKTYAETNNWFVRGLTH